MAIHFMTRAGNKLRQFGPCLIAAAAGIAVSLAAAGMTANRESQQAKLQFKVLAENHFMVIQNGLNEYVNRLRAVRALFDSSEGPVSRNAFDAFTRPLLLENAAIVTLSWVPRVLNSERGEIERSAVRQGLAGYHFKAMNPDGTIVPSPERSEYYPIFYATLPTTSALFGLDLRSEPPTLAELEHARNSDRLGFSQVPALVSAGPDQGGGFLFSLPIYKHGSLHASIEDRRRNLAGFVHGSLLTAKMIDGIITANKTPKGLELVFL